MTAAELLISVGIATAVGAIATPWPMGGWFLLISLICLVILELDK